MRFWEKILGRKKKKPKPKPPLTEGWMKGGNGYVKEPSGKPKPDIPPSPPMPPKRIINEDVKLTRKKTKTKKKRSANKMPLPDITYEYHQCKCEDWKNHLPQIVEQQQFAVNRGRKEGIDLAYKIKPFNYCPWCGWKRYRSNRGKKASK